ncbi:MAG TPA: hypothetical protein ENJ57_01260, partial [Rhizobiales bacterium]|nr:hypothetical protein [Hyphomicrobiales bacterium]
RIDLTNLANFQLRGLKSVRPSELKAALGGAGLLPRALWADRFRNIQGDPLSSLVEGELTDTGPVIAALDEALQNTPVLSACYNKFSYVVDGGGPSHIGALPHDVGLRAEKGWEGVRFRLCLAGHATVFCARPEAAPALAIGAARMALGFPAKTDSPWMKFVKQTAYRANGRAIAKLARALLALYGQQENRIRRLVRHIPRAEMLERLEGYLDGPYERLEITEEGKPALAPSIGSLVQRGENLRICGFGVPLGQLDAQSLKAIAGLADKYGQGELRLAPWHVVFIPHVPVQEAEALLSQARSLGFITDESFLHVDISACSGLEGCRGARLATPEHALAVMRAFAGQGKREHFAPLSVHVSGCPKGCAHRAVSDILALEREDASGYYVYEHSAALAPQKQSRFPETVSAEDLPRVVLEVANRQGRQEQS